MPFNPPQPTTATLWTANGGALENEVIVIKTFTDYYAPSFSYVSDPPFFEGAGNRHVALTPVRGLLVFFNAQGSLWWSDKNPMDPMPVGPAASDILVPTSELVLQGGRLFMSVGGELWLLQLCPSGAHNGIPCDDGDPCTARDTCFQSVCEGVTLSCDDGNACTTDSCAEGVGCTSTPIACDDGDSCTIDSCDPARGCVSERVGIDAALGAFRGKLRIGSCKHQRLRFATRIRRRLRHRLRRFNRSKQPIRRQLMLERALSTLDIGHLRAELWHARGRITMACLEQLDAQLDAVADRARCLAP
jgi:Dictyostelium (slime mold) repeat